MQIEYELIEERLGNNEDFEEGIKDAEFVIEKANSKTCAYRIGLMMTLTKFVEGYNAENVDEF